MHRLSPEWSRQTYDCHKGLTQELASVSFSASDKPVCVTNKLLARCFSWGASGRHMKKPPKKDWRKSMRKLTRNHPPDLCTSPVGGCDDWVYPNSGPVDDDDDDDD